MKYKCAGIISPSIVLSPREELDLSRGLSYLQNLGLKIKIAPSVAKGIKRYDNQAQDKAKDIMTMYQDKEVDILIAAHGGAGALDILEHLDYDIIAQNNKPILGFSDTTSLQMAIYARTGNPFITGFFPEYEFRGDSDITPLVDQSLQSVLNGRNFSAQSGKCEHSGTAEGILLGECLSTISDLSGTPYYPDIAGKILLLEDECESAYKISLMLTQLRYNPQFKDVRGIVMGRFSECSDHPTQGSMAEVLANFTKQAQVPMISDFNFGHFKERYVLPCGVRYRMNAGNCRLEQIEGL